MNIYSIGSILCFLFSLQVFAYPINDPTLVPAECAATPAAPLILCGGTYYLDGVGDGSDVPHAILKTTAPTLNILPNFDPGRDAYPGLVIAKGGSGIGESDATQYQLWRNPNPIDPIDQNVSLRIWTSMKDHDQTKGGSFTAYLADCQASGGDCIPLATVVRSRPDWDVYDTGSWIEEVIDLGHITHNLGGGRRLTVKIIVNSGSEDDMWFAYNTVQLPSRLILGPAGITSITCPGDITQYTAPGECGATVNYPPPTGSHPCGAVTITQTAGLPSGSVFPIGTTTNTFLATHASGATAQCSFQVMVQDTEPPAFTICPSDTLVVMSDDPCGSIIEWAGPSAADACSSVTIVQTAGTANGDLFTPGIHAISYSATDAAGNSTNCTFTVEVVDPDPPVFSMCPQDIIVATETTDCGANVSWAEPVIVADCAGTTMQMIQGLPNGSFFPIGETIITYEAMDPNGNSALCSFTVSILDNIEPVFTFCPSDTLVEGGTGCDAVVTWVEPQMTEACPGAQVTQTQGPPNGSAFPMGDTIISYTATDGSGNETNCSFTVSVIDLTVPSIICPADILVPANEGECGIMVMWDAPIATDACSTAQIQQTAGPANGSIFPIGSTSITYSATDSSGNVAMCSFLVTVQDTATPVFTFCPEDISIAAGNDCVAYPTWEIPGADDCSAFTLTQIEGPSSGSAFPIGTTVISYQATDDPGNSAVCSFSITVADVSAPMITFCPEDTTVLTGSMACSQFVSWQAPQATDPCSSVEVIQTEGPISGSELPVGEYQIVYTLTDGSGNTSTCSFTVTVIDQQPPVFASCPADLIMSSTPSGCGTPVEWIPPSAIDACSNVSVTQVQGPANGSFFPTGITTITYMATDASGNSALCSFTVSVLDDVPPVALCQSAVVILNGASVVLTPEMFNTGSSDNCGITSMIVIPASVEAPGIYPVTLTVYDAAGNSSTCTTTIEVLQNAPPVALCQDITVYLNGNGWASITASNIDGGSYDDGMIIQLTADQLEFSCDGVGQNTIVLSVTDDGGLTSTCTATVTVLDTIAPQVICQNAQYTITSMDGTAVIATADIDMGSNDNCAISGLIVDPATVTGPGTYAVTLYATDPSGNTDSCSTEVEVVFDEASSGLIIPEGFSPNGDGIADTWVVNGLEDYPSHSLVIFNRWGSELLKAAPYANDWEGDARNGSVGGGALPAGVYFYQLELGDGADVRTGYIQINR